MNPGKIDQSVLFGTPLWIITREIINLRHLLTCTGKQVELLEPCLILTRVQVVKSPGRRKDAFKFFWELRVGTCLDVRAVIRITTNGIRPGS